MKKHFLLIFYLIFNACVNLFCQNNFNIIIPTVKEETDYVWRNIQDINFFEQYNYSVNLPKGELMDSLIAKSKSNRLSDNNYDALKTFMTANVYHESDYKQGYEKILAQKDLLNKMIHKISKCESNWNFKMFPTYQINLTLYGTGGSYNPDDGSIIIFTTRDGKFKQYDNPANTLIHEIVHIGIENSIIQKYNIDHGTKERMVDLLVLLHFKKHIPGYRKQNMGNEKLDSYLKNKKSWKKLDKVVERFLTDG